MNRVLAVLMAVFLIVAGLLWLRRDGAAPAPAPVREAQVAGPAADARPAERPLGHAARPSEMAVPVGEPGDLAPPGEEPDEPATHKTPKEPSKPDPLTAPEEFREKLRAAGDPLLPEVEQLLASRGLAGTPAATAAAWAVARNWGIYLRAETSTKVEDPATQEALAASRRRILIDAPRDALTRALGGTVEASVWTDLEALGRKHQPPPPPPRKEPGPLPSAAGVDPAPAPRTRAGNAPDDP